MITATTKNLKYLLIALILSTFVLPMISAQINGIVLHCDEDTEFRVGEQGRITVTIENLFDVKKGFNLRVKECYEDFGAGDSLGFTLNGEEKITKTLSVTSGSSDNGRCLIEIKESFTNEVDTCYVNIKTLPLEDDTSNSNNNYQNDNYNKNENSNSLNNSLIIGGAIIIGLIIFAIILSRKNKK